MAKLSVAQLQELLGEMLLLAKQAGSIVRRYDNSVTRRVHAAALDAVIDVREELRKRK